MSWVSNALVHFGEATVLFFRGVLEGISLHRVVKAMRAHSELRKLVLKCFLLNGVVFIGSYLLFQYIAEPILSYFFGPDSILHPLLSAVYQIIWLYPIYIVSFVLSGKWHSSIATISFELAKIPPKGAVGSLPEMIADAAYKTLVYCSCVVQSILLDYIPVVGHTLSFALMAWVYAFLCMDTIWTMKTKYRLLRRITEFEYRWAFFLGFGTPFTLTCFFFPLLVNCGVYLLLFPIFEIMAVDVKEKEIESPPIGPLTSQGHGYFPIFTFGVQFTDIMAVILTKAIRFITGYQQSGTQSP